MKVKGLILGILVSFLAVGSANAQETLPPPDAGMQWQQTFGDEFNGTSIDTSKWNGEYANLQWCNNGQCPQDYSNVVEANGVVQISPGPTSGNPNGAHGLNSGGLTATTAKFSQRFGYFSVSAKEPPYGLYDGAPIWFDPIGKFGFPFDQGLDCNSPGGDSNEEIDFGEGYNLGCPGNNCIPNIAPDPFHMSFSYHDCQNNTPYSFLFPGNVDTSAGFHTYGLLWRNDGSVHGSFTPYFDGTPISSPIPTDPNSNLWDNGVYILLNEQGQAGPPLTIDWVHAYQQVPVGGTPTPSPTSTPAPTPTPAPGGCSMAFTSPAANATVSGTVTASVTTNGCGGDYTKWYLPDGSNVYGPLSVQFDTTKVANGGSGFYVQLFTQQQAYTGVAAGVNVTIQNGQPPVPIPATCVLNADGTYSCSANNLNLKCEVQ